MLYEVSNLAGWEGHCFGYILATFVGWDCREKQVLSLHRTLPLESWSDVNITARLQLKMSMIRKDITLKEISIREVCCPPVSVDITVDLSICHRVLNQSNHLLNQ